MQANQKVVEVVGKPGKAWGNVIVPESGSISLQILGDTIQAITKSGFEKRTSWTRIQNVDSVEIAEAPNYLLLALGTPIALMGLGLLERVFLFGLLFLAIGVILIVFAFREKRRLLVIHSLRYTIPVFMTKPPESYQQFAATVMTLARQLNNPTPPTQPTRATAQPTRPAASNTNGRVHNQAQPTRMTTQNHTSLD